ncbi:phosphotransferase [Arthrobacter sp. MI7-26]|uniref:phosphotransferase family protein n=1 Tax=Arthrobacter sp. MI7-26 TaxID=2993653 RepID=UPI002248F03D|nr:phosphotransferase [Arthrobacter sp. MI7-26]MCX2749713.1 phosphotransferase [Arthrobacter sp. MI7-26]
MSMTALNRPSADQSLALRDSALPCLADLLDNQRLSELLGEPARITRVRYKPGTSVLAAFRLTRNGHPDYGWAMTRTAAGNSKLRRRESYSSTHGGDIRLLQPDGGKPNALVAVGGFEDDWALTGNLLWLRDHGLERLGAFPRTAGRLVGGAASIVRYKPERRLVLIDHSPAGSIVIKAAAESFNYARQQHFWQWLHRHGVPVLPLLGDAGCADHGISASPFWGAGDLDAIDAADGARHAGEALARLHNAPGYAGSHPADSHPSLLGQLTATKSMITALLPILEEPAMKLAARLSYQLGAQTSHRHHTLLHGDFSPDQVLVADQDVRIIDFDRAHSGVPEAETGSFASVEEINTRAPGSQTAGGPKTAHLIEGYLQAGGRFSRANINAWAAFRLFTGSVDPFRDRAADAAWQIDRALELTK